MRLFSRSLLAGVAVVALATSGAVVARTQATQLPAEVRAGDYRLDSAHGKITWSVDHLGFSTYKGQFVNVQAQLSLNPADPSASSLTATVPLTEVDSNSDGLDRHLKTPDFFDTANHPTATFVSRAVTVHEADPTRATVVGDLTLRGVSRPVTLDVRFNRAGPSMGNAYRAGFDATATVKRSEFGINYALPAIGDEVDLHIEGEFVIQE